MTRVRPSSVIELPLDSAYTICDGLLRMSHTLMLQLPEPQLREIRHLLNNISCRADQLLDTYENDISLDFTGLTLSPDPSMDPNHPPWMEDFGAVLVSTTISTVSEETSSSPVPRTRRGTVVRPRAPSVNYGIPPTPPLAPAPAPPTHRVQSPITTRVHPPPSIRVHPDPPLGETPIPNSNPHPLVLSSRKNVGLPDYTHHPEFVQPGIPGAYLRPPTATGFAGDNEFYVISKGLYVGIFTDWTEMSPWVLGISGSVYRKYKTWYMARDIYNTRLASGAVQILS